MSVARQLCRTVHDEHHEQEASPRVFTTSFSDSVTNGVVLYGIE